MRPERPPRRQDGFALVAALGVLVVLGTMGGLMLRVSGVEQAGASLSLLGARGELAARAGVEWAVHRVVATGDCPAASSSLALDEGALTGFSVTVACASTLHREGALEQRSVEIRAEASFGAPGERDFVRREMHASVVR